MLFSKIHGKNPDIPVIITTAHSDLDSAVSAYQGGAFEYLPKPFDLAELVDVTQRAMTLALENDDIDDKTGPDNTPEIIGEAPAMQEVFRAMID